MIDENDKSTVDAFSHPVIASHYQALKAPKGAIITGRRFHGSTTDDAYRDAWQTPKWLFNFFRMKAKRFDIDAAASKSNALCEKFWTIEDDALSFDWPEKARIWLNPPYSDIVPWVEHAVKQVRENGCHVYMLIPDDCSTLWFRRGLDAATDVYFLTHDGVEGKAGKGGRVAFVNAMTGEVKNSNNKGSVVMVFKPSRKERQTHYIDRIFCETQADGFF